eukprot:GHUV01010835.1.p1 GENE.GHUV01010835.1~~GHUV01010835.1.p1  ORF type:complete len:142 (+),score=34.92 GHUV01010835.1:64-426(+)
MGAMYWVQRCGLATLHDKDFAEIEWGSLKTVQDLKGELLVIPESQQTASQPTDDGHDSGAVAAAIVTVAVEAAVAAVEAAVVAAAATRAAAAARAAVSASRPTGPSSLREPPTAGRSLAG